MWSSTSNEFYSKYSVNQACANSVDQEATPQIAASPLDLHCLPSNQLLEVYDKLAWKAVLIFMVRCIDGSNCITPRLHCGQIHLHNCYICDVSLFLFGVNIEHSGWFNHFIPHFLNCNFLPSKLDSSIGAGGVSPHEMAIGFILITHLQWTVVILNFKGPEFSF